MRNPQKSFLVGSAGWQNVPHVDAIAAVRAAGFGGVEILTKEGHFEPANPAHLEQVQNALADWPEATVTFHAPFRAVDLSSTDPAVWDKDVSYCIHALRTASVFGAESATIHTRGGANGKLWSDESFDAFRRSLDALVPVASDCKMTISVENMPPERFTYGADELLSLLEPYPAELVGVCIDTGHAHLGGTLVQVAEALASRANVMHIHDNNDVGKDEHLIPGQGSIQWPDVVSALNAGGFRGRPVIEYVVRDIPGNNIDRFANALEEMNKAIVKTGLSELNGRK